MSAQNSSLVRNDGFQLSGPWLLPHVDDAAAMHLLHKNDSAKARTR